jgi:teichoic acid transport system permease protein
MPDRCRRPRRPLRAGGPPPAPSLELTVTASAPSSVPAGLRPLGSAPSLAEYVRSVWARRQYAVASATGELRAQHMNTALGNLLHLLNPILMIAVYYLIFDVILDISRGMANFIGFLTVGILAYQWSQKTITQGSKVIIKNQGMLRSLQFPRALLPVAVVLKELLAFLPGVVLMVLVLTVTGDHPKLSWFLVLPVLVLQVCFNLGATMFMARIGDRFHDAVNLLPFLFRLAFYGSGVLFAVDVRFSRYFTNDWVINFFIANPFYAMISLWRAALMSSYSVTHLNAIWLSATLWSVLGLVIGILFFRAGEKEYGRG